MFQRNLVYSLVIILLFSLSACGKDGKFSLARSKPKKTISECLDLVKRNKHDQAIKCYEAYKSRNFGASGAQLADLAVADIYFLKKDYEIAAEAYQIFVETNPYHEKVPYAYYKAGMSYFKSTPKSVDRDQENLDKSVELLGTVLKYYRTTPYAPLAKKAFDEARLKQAQKHFYVGRLYFKRKEYLAAIPRFQVIVTEYTKLGLDEKSFYYLIVALNRTNQDDLANQYYKVFQTYYPESKYVKKIKL